ncbi:MAG: hypothetical protein Q8P11_02010 [bacterium]|nr:hypothetical protein [bacterium]
MAHIYDYAYFDDSIISFKDASLSIASSAVLCGLSVYTGNKKMGPLTTEIQKKHSDILNGNDPAYQHFLTVI